MKVAIVTTHPVQYHTPWFQKLAVQEHVDLKVYYALLPNQQQQGIGFADSFEWDIPLLEGYDWELLPNKRSSPSLRGFFGSSTPAIHSWLAAARPDVVIITGWHSLPLLQTLRACMSLKVPRIVRGESNALRPRRWWVRQVHRRLLPRFDAFLAIGKLNREFYLQYGIPEHRIFSCPYFADNYRFQRQFNETVSQRNNLRAQWKIPDGHTCYLFIGKLQPVKRLFDLLEALDCALKANPAIHLLVVGTGELMAEAQGMTERLGLPVSFAGFLNQTEVTRAYVAADCLVLPSRSETWGVVVNEAMACGLPAIVSDQVGCGPDLIEEGVTGAVFPQGDIKALASRLVDMSSASNNLAEIAQEARKRVKNYSVEEAVAGTLRAINFAVGRSDNGTARKHERIVEKALR